MFQVHNQGLLIQKSNDHENTERGLVIWEQVKCKPHFQDLYTVLLLCGCLHFYVINVRTIS